MGRTDWDAEEARWAGQIEAVVGGVRAWRAAHPRATFREIAEAVEAELGPLRAQLLAETAASSPAARFTAASADERPVCESCEGEAGGAWASATSGDDARGCDGGAGAGVRRVRRLRAGRFPPWTRSWSWARSGSTRGSWRASSCWGR